MTFFRQIWLFRYQLWVYS